MNITLSVDDQIVKTVRKIAIDRDTTLAQMVRAFLINVANTHDIDAKEAARKFRSMANSAYANRNGGTRKLSRDEIYAQRFDNSVFGRSLAARSAIARDGEREGESSGK